jgi:hypothetical protein
MGANDFRIVREPEQFCHLNTPLKAAEVCAKSINPNIEV